MPSTRFPVKVGDEVKVASCYWAKASGYPESSALQAWSGGTTARQRDAVELARLAALRWEIACESNTAASSLADLEVAVRNNPKADVTAMILVEAPWFGPRLLGVGLFHRTWAGNVFLDFLAVHPAAAGQAARIFGVGTGLLYQISEVTHHLHARLLWGETTAGSEPFYRGVFRLIEESDRLLVTPSQQEVFRRSMRERWGRQS